ncbi:diacylglycerol kinase family protein [Marmoricola sp. URHB0036]|uniref:diacylglycerol kinase family protein n=1 Tax=Marmoricola sp. URHB0036 TaxID=1298863 RepID=UPI00041FE8DF|nr:diacylglycerol kinase family protein [Marmoricola sp. URHB0036]
MTEADKRPTRLGWSALCFALFALLAILVVRDWSALLDLDSDLGRGPESFTSHHHGLFEVWRAISVATSTLPEAVLTAVVAAVLATKGYRRAAIWTVGVMASIGILVALFKLLIGRDRPVFDQPLMVYNSYSFPSGHAAGIAGAIGVTLVLTGMLVRRRGVRRLVLVLSLAIGLLVGLDRIFLGVHNVSDVIAGYLLGAGVVLAWLAFYDPTPRSIALVSPPLTEAVPNQRKKLAVILNPSKIDEADRFRVLVEALATESGYPTVVWWETSVEDTGYGMAHEAAVSGADLVLAIGGDGTIRAVCEELAGTGIPVGIVPAGTGNLLARNLDIPLYLRSAVDVALNGQDRAIDMVEVSGDKMEDATFLVMAGMGFDAAIMEGVNEDIKAKVGWLAYVWSALKSLMFPAIRIDVSVDGGEFTRHRARTMVIGNVGFLQAGMPLIPDAAIDDGRLDVVLLYPRRFLSWLPLAIRVMTRSKRTDELIARMSGREVVVRANVDAPRQLDGDLIAPGKEIRARCIHGRLLVRVPR